MTPSDYSPEQLAAIQSDSKRILVLACAGSGKTKTLIARILWLVEQGIKPNEITCITYTNNAASVLLARLGFKLQFCGTIHGWLLRLLNRHGELVGFAPGIGVVDEVKSLAMLEQIKKEHKFHGTQEQIEQELQRWPARAQSKAELVVAAYRNKLRQNNAMDFSSIVHWGKLLVQKLPNSLGCVALFWDEFQDASDDFVEIYNSFKVEYRFACGDKNQAIFSFLSGNVDNIICESKNETTTVFRLMTNYRCARYICLAATRLTLKGGGFVHTERTDPRPDAPNGLVDMVDHADFQAEIKWMAQKIRELNCEKSCAIILRTNPLIEKYKLALASYSIPIVEKKFVASTPDWLRTRALLAALASPENDLVCESFLVALRGPEFAAEQMRAAIQAMKSINQHCLHLPSLDLASDAIGFIASKQPSPESVARLKAAAEPLGEEATIGELILALQEPAKQEQAAEAVLVTTPHSAKALEFETVIIGAAEEGIMPWRSAKTEAELAEERRCFYVAVTRAKSNLFFSWCRNRQEKWGPNAEMQRSRFISDCGLA